MSIILKKFYRYQLYFYHIKISPIMFYLDVEENMQPLNMKIQKTIYFVIVSSLIFFLNISACYGFIRTVTGIVTKVSDGDTIQLTTPEQTTLKVRLYGIDAPETYKMNKRTGQVSLPGQPYGDESMKALENKIMGKNVTIVILEIDKYRRMVGMILLNSRNINLEMIREGHAEAFIEYLDEPYRSEFIKTEQQARSAHKGIWSIRNYERPREFRKKLKERRQN